MVKDDNDMAISDFRSAMQSRLVFCADGKDHTSREASDTLAPEGKLAEDELMT